MSAALLPGSFDPITVGHLDVIRRAAVLFDSVTVLVAKNASKKYLLSDEARLALVTDAIADIPHARAELFGGYLVDYATAHGNPVFVKGVRNAKDFEYEREMAAYNRALSLRKYGTTLETLLLPASADVSEVSSTLVRTLLSVQVDYDDLVPNAALFRHYLQKQSHV